MLDPAVIQDFLAQRRIAVVGVSQRPAAFANTVVRELLAHGYEAVPIGRTIDFVEGQPCYQRLADVPVPVDGVVVMVTGDAVPAVLADAAAAGVSRVWLFKGLGGPGAFSEDAVARARGHGMQVVEGACPLMFLEPVGGFHKVHRLFRRLNGSLPKKAVEAA